MNSVMRAAFVATLMLVTFTFSHAAYSADYGIQLDPAYDVDFATDYGSSGSSQPSPSQGYVCKSTGNGYGACAQSLRTGQCTMSWSKRDTDNPMAACQRYISRKTGSTGGTRPSQAYVCQSTGNGYGVCAKNLRTGQCTMSWSKRDVDNPMWFCQRYVSGSRGSGGTRTPSQGYVCKSTGNGYGACAKSLRTGQCTMSWSKRDVNSPMGSCQRWVSNR